jgi:hypothetical protein
MITLENKLLKYSVVRDNGCREWIAGVHPFGYGQVRDGDRTIGSHRASYEVWVGPIPDGLFVCHTCDNPPCIEPSHLFLGTADDNMQDKTQKMRGSYGEGVNTAKLRESDLIDIKYLRDAGLTFAKIAERYGVHWKTISRALNGRTWKHAQSPSN